MAPRLLGPGHCTAPSLDKRSYAFMAAAFVEAFHVLGDLSSPIYDDMLIYIRKSSNLLVLCQTLLLADTERQPKLWRLVPSVTFSLWASCLQDLTAFGLSDVARVTFEELRMNHVHPYRDVDQPLTYFAYENVLHRFATHVREHHHDCNCYADAVESSRVDRRWRTHSREGDPQGGSRIV
ncbi:hypothetical protein CPB85DRAFT_1012408 [Mucidula mucida]|nr:hypothetical protein CPB85DRAFT_1012408 [Mucidula mucida]